MTTFQDIADDVSADLNVGTTTDDIILKKVYEAHRTLQANNNFVYMERQLDSVQSAGDLSFSVTIYTKRLNVVRYEYEGRYRYLEEIHPGDLNSIPNYPPQYYYRVGDNEYKLFQAFSIDTTLNKFYSSFISSYSPNGSDWLTDRAGPLIHYMAVGAMSVPLHDPTLLQLVAPLIETHLKTVLLMDDELREGTQSEVMRYG